MKGNLTGLFLSGLLHAGLIGWVTTASHIPEKKQVPVKTHQLTVKLFQSEKITPIAPPVLVVEKKVVVEEKEKEKEKSKQTIPPSVAKIVKKVDVTEKPKEKAAVETTPKPQMKVKPLIVAVVKPEPPIKKLKPKVKPRPVKAITGKRKEARKKPVRKERKRVVKVVPKLKSKLKLKKKIVLKRRIKKKVIVKKVVRRSVRKTVQKRKVLKPAVQARAKPRVRQKPKVKPRARPRVPPKARSRVVAKQRRNLAVRRVQHQPRAKVIARSRKALAVRKHVKIRGVVKNRKTVSTRRQTNIVVKAKRPINIRKPVRRQPAKARQVYRKPVQQHQRKSVPARRPTNTNTALVASLSKQYKARLHQLIASITKRNYPKRAKRRNQQGRVYLSFTISHSGTVSNIKILKGSNVTVLDKAAIKAIQQASRKLPFLRGMPKKSINLTMTVVYVLG